MRFSVAGHQRTAGIPAGGGRADTPAGGGLAGIPVGAILYYGWAYMLALWGKGDTEGAPTWRQVRRINICACTRYLQYSRL
jgi:hypothetical protein